MFLHLGGDYLIDQEKIIMIIDLETGTKGQLSEQFLERINNNEDIIYISEKGKEKSLIITDKEIYYSPISSSTLLKRSNNFDIVFQR